MIDIKCATCGNTFQVPDEQSGKGAQCPGCGAMTLAPAVSAAQPEAPEPQAAKPEVSEPEAPAPQPPAQVERPQRFLTPLELALILIVIGIVAALVIYKFVGEIPSPPTPAGDDQALVEMREKRLTQQCFARMEKIAGALDKYREKHKALPPDMDALKEAGFLEPEVPLSCPKTKARYLYYAPEADVAKNVVDDPVLIADTEHAHRDGRAIIRLSGTVERHTEDVVKEILVAQRREFEKLDAHKSKEAFEKMRKEKDAADLMIDAATAIQTGHPADAIKIYQDLLENYADTRVVEKQRSKIEDKVRKIIFDADVEEVRKLVYQLRLEEARQAYAQLARDATGEQKKVLDSELEDIKLIEEGRSLLTLGDLDGAIEIYNRLGSTSADPFWKRVAHQLALEVQKYRLDASLLYKSAQEAEKKGNKVWALSQYMALRDNYPYSAEAPKAPPKIVELVNEVPYRKRFLPKMLRDKKKETARAIKNGLTYLALSQRPDGSWRSRSTGARALDEVALTGLAMLCFLAEGSTHLAGEYREVVAKALERLKAAQSARGLFGDPEKPTYRMSHALALLAFSELRNMTGDDNLTSFCKKGLHFTIKLKEMGLGWRLGERETPEDIMLTTWMQLGMLSAAKGSIEFLPGLLEGAGNTYNTASDPQGRVHFEGLEDPTRPRRHLPRYQTSLIATAAAAYGKLTSGTGPGTTRLKGAFSFLNENLPNQSLTSFPYFFFGTYAQWQMEELTFRQWNWALKAVLLSSQLTSGKDAGAWDMGRFTDFRGGKVYPTALALLSLQAPYNQFACIDRRAQAKEAKPKPRRDKVILNISGHIIEGEVISETEDIIVIEVVKGTTRAEMTYNKKDVKEIKREK